MKKTINPFLHFNGNCREAIEYYKEIFQGKIELLMHPKGEFADHFASSDAIMHSVLSFYDGMIIMAADTRIGLEATVGNNNFIVINFSSEDEIDRVYKLFAQDAIQIREELNKVFWGAKYAEFVDKFGISWMFNFDYPSKDCNLSQAYSLSQDYNLPLEYQKMPEFFDTEDTKSSLDDWNKYNAVFEKILREHQVKTILDLTCGTGSQVFYLHKLGYDVIGSDFSPPLIQIAKNRAKQQNLDIQFIDGDMRNVHLGKFDACITMFNAIGHVSKEDFKITIKNIYNNLSDKGMYLFDIFNINALTDEVLKTFAYQSQKYINNTTMLHSQASTIDKQNSLLISYDSYMIQKNCSKPEIIQNEFMLRIYSLNELKELLIECGFTIVKCYALDGSEFIDDKSQSILILAIK